MALFFANIILFSYVCNSLILIIMTNSDLILNANLIALSSKVKAIENILSSAQLEVYKVNLEQIFEKAISDFLQKNLQAQDHEAFHIQARRLISEFPL